MSKGNTVKIKITADNSDYRKAMGELGPIAKKASEGFTVLKGTLAGLLSEGIQRVSAAITENLGAAISRVDTINAYRKTMTNLGLDIDAAGFTIENAIDTMQEGIANLPTSTPYIYSLQQRFAALSGELKNSTALTLAVNDATLAGGQGMEKASAAADQWYQMIAAGKPDLMSMKIINEAMPAQLDAISKSLLGETANWSNLYSEWQAGTITTEQVQQALIDLDQNGAANMKSFRQQAEDATGGIGTALDVMKSRITTQLGNVIEAIGTDNITRPIKAVTDLINNLGGIAVKAATYITANWDKISSAMKKIVPVIGAVAASMTALKAGMMISGAVAALRAALTMTTTVLAMYSSGASAATVLTTGLGTATKVMSTILALATGKIKLAEVAQWAWNAALSANPIGLIIIGIVALIGIIVLLWKKCDWFRNGVKAIWNYIKSLWASFKGVWDKIEPYVSEALQKIKKKFDDILPKIAAFFVEAWEQIKKTWDAVEPYFQELWDIIKVIFSVACQIIGTYFHVVWTVIKAVWDFVVPYFTGVWEGIKIIFAVAEEVLGAYFRTAWEVIKFVWDVAIKYFAGVMNGIKIVFSVVATVLGGFFRAAYTVVTTIWNAAVGFFQGIWNGIVAIFSGIKDKFSTWFSDAYETVKEKFTLDNFKAVFEESIIGGLEAIKTSVTTKAGEIWDKLKEALKKAIPIDFSFGFGDGWDESSLGAAGGKLSPFASARISSGFGYRTHPITGKRKLHAGVDLAAPKGTPIQSTTFGRVYKVAYQAGGFGNYVVVQDQTGNLHYYAHMSRTAAHTGQMVMRGTRIGYVGSTGASTGNHLHYGVKIGGSWVNPMKWVNAARYETGGFPAQGEMFIANEKGIEMMGRMGAKNVVANNMQIIDGIRAGVYAGIAQAAKTGGDTTKTNNINITQNFYTPIASPSETKRAARRGLKTSLAGGIN